MRLLLDTHAFLWWILDAAQLSSTARRVIGDIDNEVLVSAASAWEIAVKARRDRLPLPQTPERFVPRQVQANGFLALPIRMEHALRVYALPDYHRDPFDRLLIAQALEDRLAVVTADPQFGKYPVRTLW